MSNVDVQGLGVALGCTVLMACGGLSDRADGKNHDASGGTESGGAAGGANGAAGTETVRGGGPSAGGSSGSGGTAGTDPGGTGAGGEPDVGGAGGQPETTRLFVNGLAFGNDGFVATAEEDLPNGIDYGGVIFRSSDGLTWERVLTDELVPFDVEFGNGVFVSLAKRIDYPPGTWSAGGFVSSDGRTWTRVDVPASEPGQRMAFGNGTFIGVGDTGRL
ncbi:MAG TPA: hypothetical protein VFZ53_13350, partial [Polyangiaceae bacterium]